MDANFFATLKLIAAAEKRHNFRTRSYDVAALALKHPQNVISVAPALSKAPPPRLPGETRVTKLSDAIHAAVRRAREGGVKGRSGCSILVHEGVYIDPLSAVGNFPKEFSLEIVGVKNVRLIFETLDCFPISMNLTLRNVSVFDRRLHRFYPAIIVERGGCFELIRANVHTPKVIAISLKESKLMLVRTTVTDCCTAVCSGKSDLRLTECVIDSCSPIWPSFSFKDSNCLARNIRCSSSIAQCADFARSKVTMEDCQFKITS